MNPTWIEEAACQNYTYIFDETYMYGHHTELAQKLAKQICATCPVITQCEKHAASFETTNRTVHGVWAGMTPTERLDKYKQTRLTKTT